MALMASLGSLLLISVVTISCVGCLKSFALGNKKAIDAKKPDIESAASKPTDVKMAASNSQENTSELYSAITDSQMSTKATVTVTRDASVKEESPYDLPGDIEALFGDRTNLYTKIERKHDDIKMIDADAESTYGRPEVPSKNFDYVKASRTFGGDDEAHYASYYGAKSIAGSNHYELGSNLSSSHYDVLPEYETISQMMLVQQRQAAVSGRYAVVDEETITLNEELEDAYYSNLNHNETSRIGDLSEIGTIGCARPAINVTIHKL